MAEYTVTFSINISANTPVVAAKQARQMIIDSDDYFVWEVYDEAGQKTTVDLEELWEPSDAELEELQESLQRDGLI